MNHMCNLLCCGTESPSFALALEGIFAFSTLACIVAAPIVPCSDITLCLKRRFRGSNICICITDQDY